MSEITKRERVTAALRGHPVDRPPISFWGHDFLREWTAEGLAAAMLEPVRAFDYDYLKVNPRACYFAEAWGCRYRPSGDGSRGPETEHWVLREASDLRTITPADVQAGSFGEQLEALRLIAGELEGEVPFVQTVFSPLSVIDRMANSDRDLVRRWMAEEPAALHAALEPVTETLATYSRAALGAGADGIFFATTEWGTRDACSDEEYDAFGRPYDLRVLAAAEGAPMNILHVCRGNNRLESLLDYPVAAVNWAVHAPDNPSLADIAGRTEKAVMGGLNERRTLLSGSPDEVRAQVQEAITQTKGERFLAGPGCAISPLTPPSNLRAAVEAVRAPRP